MRKTLLFLFAISYLNATAQQRNWSLNNLWPEDWLVKNTNRASQAIYYEGKKEITLYDEIETCRLYLQLEAMRFKNKLSYVVNIGENIDLKSLFVPALIIQPFIENAIWHGIVPKEDGGTVLLNVLKEHGTIKIVVDDDGIGRVASQQNKSGSSLTHQSKGINLTQSRLALDNLLKQRQLRLEMVDKKNENGITTGTAAIIILAADSEQ